MLVSLTTLLEFVIVVVNFTGVKEENENTFRPNINLMEAKVTYKM